MPGGVEGVRQMVADFHRRGVRVLFPMMMWDEGTNPPPAAPDSMAWPDAIAALMKQIGADGEIRRETSRISIARPWRWQLRLIFCPDPERPDERNARAAARPAPLIGPAFSAGFAANKTIDPQCPAGGLPGFRLADDQIFVPKRQNYVDLATLLLVGAIRYGLPQRTSGPVLRALRQQSNGANGIVLVVF